MNNKGSLKGKIFATFVITLIICIVAAFSFIKIFGITFISSDKYKELNDNYLKYEKIGKIESLIEKKSLWNNKKMSHEQRMDKLYHDMVGELDDPYSRYLNKGEREALEASLNGNFQGIGVTLKTDEKGNFVVTDVVKDGPAFVSGIKQGDIVKKVDGKTYDALNKLAEAIRGKSGSVVKLTVIRDEKEKSISVVRGKIEGDVVSVSTIAEGKIGYIQIKTFGKGSADKVREALKEMETKSLKGVIIDLRDNPGGLLEEGVAVADLLLPEGVITYTEDNKGKKEYYRSKKGHTSLKYVVLVNENTASAAELLTAAVKDNKGGVVIGMKTFGKGIAQEIFFFKDGTALSITSKQYFSPKGNVVNKVGVKPDIEVKQGALSEEDKQLKKAIEVIGQ